MNNSNGRPGNSERAAFAYDLEKIKIIKISTDVHTMKYLLFLLSIDTMQRNFLAHLHWLLRVYQFCCLILALDSLTELHLLAVSPARFCSLGTCHGPRHRSKRRLHQQLGSNLSILDVL